MCFIRHFDPNRSDPVRLCDFKCSLQSRDFKGPKKGVSHGKNLACIPRTSETYSKNLTIKCWSA
jgi:hypothetical protein